MKLIALDEKKLERILTVLAPLPKQLQSQGCEQQAAEIVDLRRYLRSKIELGPEIKDAKDRGRLGGCSKSRVKQNAARDNGKLGGPPGNYYGRLLIAESNQLMPTLVIDYVFPNRRKRDEWISGPGKRETLLTVDRDLRIAQMQDPDSLANGDPQRLRELEGEELHEMFERKDDVMEQCTGCSALNHPLQLQSLADNRLCSYCCSKQRFLRS